MNSKKYHQLLSILVIVAAIYFSFNLLLPKPIIETNLPTDKLSINNALTHLKEITKKPHFTGSKEHKVVRDYLVKELKKLGLEVEIQEQIAVNKKWRAATNTQNILARIKGTGNGKAVMLLSHYDSNPHSSLGASDAGSGVVVILEGIRAFLAKNTFPKNDIIIGFTDAEELGLLGANAFVNHHPWAKDVKLVLNFEARGSGGPSYLLLETNGGNKNLIEAFQKTNTTRPVGNSLMYSIYKMLPNDTDLTVFREHGDIEGFNFAFIGDHFDYHTSQDSFERMDLNSLQHQAMYLEATLNYFANSELTNLKAIEDDVYFNFPYVGLVHYPFFWVTPMYLISVVVFVILLLVGFLKNRLTAIGVLKGFIPFILSLVISGLFTYLGWKLLLKIHPQYHDILHGFTYNGYYYIAMFVAFTLAISYWFYKGFLKKRTAQDLLIAPLFFWLIINFGTTFYLKGAGFFILPVFITLTILSILLFSNSTKNNLWVCTFLVVPILIIFTPLIQMLPVGLGLKMLVISAVFTVLLFGLLIPIIQQYKNYKKWVHLFLFIGCLLLVTASLKATYNEDRKQPNSILYVLDVNKNEAYWASYNNKSDAFTQQFLGDHPAKGSYDKNTTASKYKTNIQLHTKTQIRNFKKPLISIVSDTIVNDTRKVCLSLVTQRNANKFEILTHTPIKFKSFKVNDEALKNEPTNGYVLNISKGTIMGYYITKESELIDLEFIVAKDQKFDIDVLEVKYDLFTNSQFNFKPRSKSMIPTPFVLNDATVIKMNLKF